VAVSRAELGAARDLLAPLGAVIHRHMMGGAILYSDGRIFGAIMGPQGLHVRARGSLAERFAADGSMQVAWTSPKTGQTQVTGCRSLPDAALDDPEAACEWARTALDAGD